MERLIIHGGVRLSGEVRVDSAKNAVLPILAASVLHNGTVHIHNCVKIKDVENMLLLLKGLGCKVECFDNDTTLTLHADSANSWTISHDTAHEIRSSIFLLGSLLSRFATAKVSYPGGCDIGLRPIDLHIKGLKELGVDIQEENGYIICDGKYMHAGSIHLDFPSVGATENIMMAAVKLPGITTITNAAKEPEIVDLQNFINSMGGRVQGAGTGTVQIEGVQTLHDTEYTPIPDRIIAGTYLLAGAITGGDIMIHNTCPQDMSALLAKLRESGCHIKLEQNAIRLVCPYRPSSCQEIQTMPHPGFATDLQAQMTAFQSICDGTCMMIENLFETRYKYIPELLKMGANISVHGKCAIIRGVKILRGTTVNALDLRGGAALVLAGLRAESATTVQNVAVIDRGYCNIENALSSLRADIRRIGTPGENN